MPTYSLWLTAASASAMPAQDIDVIAIIDSAAWHHRQVRSHYSPEAEQVLGRSTITSKGVVFGDDTRATVAATWRDWLEVGVAGSLRRNSDEYLHVTDYTSWTYTSNSGGSTLSWRLYPMLSTDLTLEGPLSLLLSARGGFGRDTSLHWDKGGDTTSGMSWRLWGGAGGLRCDVGERAGIQLTAEHLRGKVRDPWFDPDGADAQFIDHIEYLQRTSIETAVRTGLYLRW